MDFGCNDSVKPNALKDEWGRMNGNLCLRMMLSIFLLIEN